MPDSDHDGVADDYGMCLQGGLTDPEATDTDTPPTGSAYFYQVTAETSSAEGPMGNASNGLPRPNVFPCP